MTHLDFNPGHRAGVFLRWRISAVATCRLDGSPESARRLVKKASGGGSHSEIRPVREVSMLRAISVSAVAMLTMVDAALAQQAAYTWTGMGQGRENARATR